MRKFFSMLLSGTVVLVLYFFYLYLTGGPSVYKLIYLVPSVGYLTGVLLFATYYFKRINRHFVLDRVRKDTVEIRNSNVFIFCYFSPETFTKRLYKSAIKINEMKGFLRSKKIEKIQFSSMTIYPPKRYLKAVGKPSRKNMLQYHLAKFMNVYTWFHQTAGRTETRDFEFTLDEFERYVNRSVKPKFVKPLSTSNIVDMNKLRAKVGTDKN